MRYARCGWFITLLGFMSLATGASVRPASPPQLTFVQRVAAQRAIERVYYAHQTDATLPFEEAVPPEAIERKVRDYLRQSAALEKQWGAPITAAMLKDEALRISRSTRMPDRLRELYAALNNDPVLVLECLVRPALASHLTRARFATDDSLQVITHEQAAAQPGRPVAGNQGRDKRSWDDWWSETAPSFDTTLVTTVASSDILPQPQITGGCAFDDIWDRSGGLSPRAAGHTAVWTGSRLIVWGGNSEGGAINTGVQYDPVTDISTPTSTLNAPEARTQHTAVWTGSRMIVWGGKRTTPGYFSTGGSYDPVSDTWSAMSMINAPSGRMEHSAVWTGTLMVVWGGYSGLNTGGRYDPQTDQWSPMSSVPASQGRHQHTAVWTGTSMIVWGGSNGSSRLSTGGRYNPVADTWTPTSALNAPAARIHHTAVWTGSRMIVWGGGDQVVMNTGALYDETLDEWTAMPLAGAPTARSEHTAVWTGSRMMVWGGMGQFFPAVGTGGLFDPVAGTWSPVATTGAPLTRDGHTAVWTGNQVIIWGGFNGELYAHYNPVTDTWMKSDYRPMHATGTGIWTGSLMIIDAGGSQPASTRFEIYDPVLELWRPASTVGQPSGIVGPGGAPMVWTGQHVIVEAKRYDPVADTWSVISTVNAPPRGSAVWAGSEMILWSPDGGGRYDPVTDTWASMSMTGAPTSVSEWSMVWSGNHVILWGVFVAGNLMSNSGGRYDPSTDTWSPMSLSTGNRATSGYRSVMAGERMVVFGGFYLECVSPGCTAQAGYRRRYDATLSSYDPVSDAWSPLDVGVSGGDGVTAVSTGTAAVFWGGAFTPCPNGGVCGPPGTAAVQSGIRFNPQTGTITPMSTQNAPTARYRSIGVWTGHEIIVWGGLTASGSTIHDGGRYGVGPSPRPDLDTDGYDVNCDCDDADASVYPGGVQICGDGVNNDCSDPAWPGLSGTNESDEDGDSMTECAGDCDDTQAIVRPGAPQLCDGINNDCNAAGWPTPPANEADQDADGVRVCGGDCDDIHASVRPGAPQICDGLNNNCNDPSWPAITPAEADQDTDSFRPCSGDCDDGRASVKPGGSQICGDGLNNNCNDPAWPALNGTNERDDDADGFTECAGDCDDLAAATHPAAAEVNDGLDNQCPADPGFGSVDEVSQLSFPVASDTTRVCWVVQPGATTYRLAVSGDRFTGDQECRAPVSAACDNDVQLPPTGRAFFYLVRAETPFAGSWGQRSTGVEAGVNCGTGGPTTEFSFDDHLLVDDVSNDALFSFFNQMAPPSTSGYILVEIESSPGIVDSLCSRRPDFYRTNYLSMATSGGVVMSGTWDKWYRPANGGWQGPITGGISDRYGSSCSAPYSWCAMWGLGGVWLWIDPAATQECEVSNDSAGCGTGGHLRIRVGSDRLRTCGF